MKSDLTISELYQISFPNGKRYIGISNNAKNRFYTHKTQSRAGRQTPLAAALRKYGAKLEVLCIGDRQYILDLEVKAIEIFQTQNREFGYNVGPGGETSGIEGIGHSEKTRAKMSLSQQLRKRTPEELAMMSVIAKKHDKTNPEYRDKCRQSAINRWSRPGEREKQSKRITNHLKGFR